MKAEIFDDICADRVIHCLNVLGKKKEEYSREADRFLNFKWSAQLMRTSVPYACLFLASKHLVSIAFDIKSIEDCEVVDVERLCNEKITDAINYLLLLEGILTEEYRGKDGHVSNIGSARDDTVVVPDVVVGVGTFKDELGPGCRE